MRAKKITAAAIAAVLATGGLSGLPTAYAYGEDVITYTGVIGTMKPGDTPTAVDGNAEASGDAWLTNTIPYGDILDAVETDSIVSYNATEFKKVLELEDNASIPSCSFDYEVTVPSAVVPATYNPETGAISTLAVFPGINKGSIVYKFENADENAFVTDSVTDYALAGSLQGKDGFKISYSPINVELPDDAAEGAASLLSTSADEFLLINNINVENGKEGVDTYYAIKTVQLDFSACGFIEPGVYRYYIQESGNNLGITNDYLVTGNDNCWRTIDVYVEDATYTASETADYEPEKTLNDLRIAGYVMYVGKQTKGPAAGIIIQDSEANAMEDGLPHTNPSGDGGDNGYEVDGAVKSEGIRNFYDTNELTFAKNVSGNQASKDKFFKFNLKITDKSDNTNIGNNDIFIISVDSTQVVIDDWANDTTNTPNRATSYKKGTIYTANVAHPYTVQVHDAQTDEDVDTVVYRYVTGSELKAGKDFYLQNGQSITIQGLPTGVGYELKEWQDDYTPNVRLKATSGDDVYDNHTADDTADEALIQTSSIVIESGSTTPESGDPTRTAKIVDSAINADVDITFTNNRNGVIPTGIGLTAVPAIAALVVLAGGVVVLLVRKNREEE